ncbi:MAG: hypothetical protein ABH837_01105 [bacterium]
MKYSALLAVLVFFLLGCGMSNPLGIPNSEPEFSPELLEFYNTFPENGSVTHPDTQIYIEYIGPADRFELLPLEIHLTQKTPDGNWKQIWSNFRKEGTRYYLESSKVLERNKKYRIWLKVVDGRWVFLPVFTTI